MAQIIKATGILISKNEKGELLLTVGFKNLGDEKATTETRYSWMPQWETVRQLIFSAIIVEAFNRVGNQELSDFEACITLCQKVRNNLSGLLSGQMGIES